MKRDVVEYFLIFMYYAVNTTKIKIEIGSLASRSVQIVSVKCTIMHLTS